MSLCINPGCRQPNHPDNDSRDVCAACGTALVLQGRYRVMRLISKDSGFGQVYEAYERNVPKILKVLKAGHSSNAKVVELFRREAQVLSQLNHPGVPRVEAEGYFLHYPADGAEPVHCLVMEKIDGPNLRQWMVQQGNHPISEKQAMLWLAQLTDILNLVHQHNYFHRDIKPENIMLRPSGQLVLVDFGAAREMTQTYMANLGDSGITALSSAGYTPPEQEQGQAVPQSDFYALGRTLIYLMTAKLPNDPEVYDSRTNAFLWRPNAPQISAPLADLVDDLIAPAAVNRPQTTAAILEHLAQVRSRQISGQVGANTSATRPDWPVTTLDPQGNKPTHFPSRSFLPPWLDQRPWLLAGLTGVALAIPLGWYAMTQTRSSSVAESEVIEMVPQIEVQFLGKLPGHQADIRDMMLLKDGHTLVTASSDATIRFWDLQTETLLHVLSQHTNAVKALAMTTDQDILITAGDDRTIRFWTMADGQPLVTLVDAHPLPINALEVSHNGKFLISADSGGDIYLWDLTDQTGRINPQTLVETGPTRRLMADGTVNDLRFTRDDSYLVSGGKSLQLWVMDDLDRPITLSGHEPLTFINRLDISDDNRTLVSASSDQTVRLWNLVDQTPKAILKGHQSYVNDVRIDGPLLLSSDAAQTIRVWDLHKNAHVETMTGFDTDIWRFAIQPNGQIITLGGTEHVVSLWSLPSDTLSQRLP
ncbi:MAG: serine/threonine-protein kinase [Cyanobacteria bacterium J06638_6]